MTGQQKDFKNVHKVQRALPLNRPPFLVLFSTKEVKTMLAEVPQFSFALFLFIGTLQSTQSGPINCCPRFSSLESSTSEKTLTNH